MSTINRLFYKRTSKTKFFSKLNQSEIRYYI